MFINFVLKDLLKSDREIETINWTVYGKIESVLKRDGTEIDYKYDGTGQRIYKKVVSSSVSKETHYIRDGSGNVLAIYENEVLDELVIYGSSRLGSYNGKTDQGKRTLGNKKYELSNHLGNVLSVISDNKIGIDSDTDLIADYYEPLVISESDYYPFGMAMKERSFENEEYRFGFNGMEEDRDFGSEITDHGARLYNKALGRWFACDPLEAKYPELSTYAFVMNKPIIAIDPDGRSVKITNVKMTLGNDGKITKITFDIVISMTIVNASSKNDPEIKRQVEQQINNITKTLKGSGTAMYGSSIKQHIGSESVTLSEMVIYEVNKVNVDVKYEEKLSDNIRHDDHVMIIVDDINTETYEDGTQIDPGGITAAAPSEVALIRAERFLNPKDNANTHEFFHMLGLDHPFPIVYADNIKDMTLMGYGDPNSFYLSNLQRGELGTILFFTYIRGQMKEFEQVTLGTDEHGKTTKTKKNTKTYEKSAYEKGKEHLKNEAKTYNENKVK